MSPANVGKSSKPKKSEILEQVMILLSGYPRDDYTNSDLFIRQLEQIFMEYPPSVIKAVTSPGTGIQRYLKFRPTIAEIVEALDREMEVFKRKSLEHRLQRIAQQEPEINRSNRLALEELLERTEAGRYWAQRFAKDRAIPAWVRPINEIMREGGVTQDQLDKIPNAKQSTGPPASDLMTSEDEKAI